MVNHVVELTIFFLLKKKEKELTIFLNVTKRDVN